jgi:hypothetical protein
MTGMLVIGALGVAGYLVYRHFKHKKGTTVSHPAPPEPTP